MPPGTVSDLSRNVARLKALTGINGEPAQIRETVRGNDNAPQGDELLLLLQKQDQVILQMQQELHTYEVRFRLLVAFLKGLFLGRHAAIKREHNGFV